MANGETVLTNILFETDNEDQAYEEEIRHISLFDVDKLVNVPRAAGLGRISRPEPLERLTVHLPAELREQLEREAKEDRRTLSAFVEIALLERFKAKAATQ